MLKIRGITDLLNQRIGLNFWLPIIVQKKCHKGTSHEHWKCPNCHRTITFRSQYKEIPAMHLKTNLITMDYNLDYLYKWLENN
ncbi:hypothetical protein MNBD_BACTEROID03-2724 [hydrothermal vent metagenome]|uniref:Transposase zinc-ribbon domain-containing protein n=1 Tax=hydrothermal vent metagenome TaxID=652676 RepID=A0A3B0TQA6_9ZZZZ